MDRTLFHLWPDRELGHVLLTTYTLHAPFFEAVILPELQRRGARSVTVFADAHEGFRSATGTLTLLRSVGVTWLLVPVAWPTRGVFHPKVHLFTGCNTALVGSGNLTPLGCGGNLEAFDVLTASNDGTAVSQARTFFRSLLALGASRLPPDQRARLARYVDVGDDAKPSGSAQFVSTVAGAGLFAGVQEQWPDAAPSRLLVAAPFQDADHGTTRGLAKMLAARTVRVAAQPDIIAPLKKAHAGWATGRAADPRPLHAKLVLSVTDEVAMLILGSANLTEAAWSGVNCEAITVRTEFEPDAFDEALPASWFEPCAWTGEPWTADPPSTALPPVPVLWASLVGDHLTVQLAANVPDTTWHAETGEQRFRIALDTDLVDLTAGGTWPLARSGVAVVHVSAPGWEAVRLPVAHAELLGAVPRVVSVRQALQRLSDGRGSELDEMELLVVIGEFVRAAVTPSRKATLRATHGVDQAPDENLAEDPIVQVQELVLGRGRATGSVRAIAEHLLAAVRRLRADMAKRVGTASADDHDVEATSDDGERGATSSVSPQTGLSTDTLRRVMRESAGLVRLFATSDADRAIALFDTAIDTLGWLHDRGSHPVDCARQAVQWLAEAWAIADWPFADSRGWALGLSERPAVQPSIQCLGWAVEKLGGIDTLPAERDQLVRIVRGLELAAGGEIDHAIAANLRADPTRGDYGRSVVGPLWALDITCAALQNTDHAIAEIEREAAACAEIVSKLVARNTRHKAAAERREQLVEEIKPLRERQVKEQTAFENARQAAVDAKFRSGQTVLALWRSRTGSGRRRLAVRTGDECPCGMALPTRLIASADPAEPVSCGYCQKLLAWPVLEEAPHG